MFFSAAYFEYVSICYKYKIKDPSCFVSCIKHRVWNDFAKNVKSFSCAVML